MLDVTISLYSPSSHVNHTPLVCYCHKPIHSARKLVFFLLLLLVILLFLNIGPWFFVYLLHFTLLQQKLVRHTHTHKNSPSHHGANKTLKSQEPHNYFHCFQNISGIGFQGGVYLLVYQVSGSMQQTFMMCCIYTKRLNWEQNIWNLYAPAAAETLTYIYRISTATSSFPVLLKQKMSFHLESGEVEYHTNYLLISIL